MVEEIWKNINKLAEVVKIIAIIGGAIWAIYRFRLFREYTSNPQMCLEHKLLPYSENSRLLVVYIKVLNIGKIDIHAEKIAFSLKALPKIKPAGTILHWEDGEYITKEFDVIKQSNPEDFSGKYMLEPGDQYKELFSIIAPIDTHLIVQAHYKGKEGDDFCVYDIWYIESDLSKI